MSASGWRPGERVLNKRENCESPATCSSWRLRSVSEHAYQRPVGIDAKSENLLGIDGMDQEMETATGYIVATREIHSSMLYYQQVREAPSP